MHVINIFDIWLNFFEYIPFFLHVIIIFDIWLNFFKYINEDVKNKDNLTLKNYLMTSHLDSYTTTPLLMLNRKCYQEFKPEMELHMIYIIYAALPMREQTEKTTFSCKDD